LINIHPVKVDSNAEICHLNALVIILKMKSSIHSSIDRDDVISVSMIEDAVRRAKIAQYHSIVDA
jgi:hypothetical protein